VRGEHAVEQRRAARRGHEPREEERRAEEAGCVRAVPDGLLRSQGQRGAPGTGAGARTKYWFVSWENVSTLEVPSARGARRGSARETHAATSTPKTKKMIVKSIRSRGDMCDSGGCEKPSHARRSEPIDCERSDPAYAANITMSAGSRRDSAQSSLGGVGGAELGRQVSRWMSAARKYSATDPTSRTEGAATVPMMASTNICVTLVCHLPMLSPTTD
jgi:hypothetical protein